VTHWDRVRAGAITTCGLCRKEIPVGGPVLVISIGTVVKKRCDGCDGPAPPDLPAHIELAPPISVLPLVRFAPGMLPLDFKSRQTGEREPGEDDDA